MRYTRPTSAAATPALWIFLVALILMTAWLSGCALLDPNDKQHKVVGEEMEFIPLGSFDRDDYPDDPVSVSALAIRNDSLVVTLSYSGGCAEHRFRLLATNYWLESLPVQLDALLVHEDPGDACDAIITLDKVFGLETFRQEYMASYGSPGDAIINVHDGNSASTSIRYQFQ